MNELKNIPKQVKELSKKFAQDKNLKIINKSVWQNIYYKKGEYKLQKLLDFIWSTGKFTTVNEVIINEHYMDCLNFRNNCFKIVMFIEELFGSFLSSYYSDFYLRNYINSKKTLGRLFRERNSPNFSMKNEILNTYFEKYLEVEIPNASETFDNYVKVRNDVCHPKFLGLLDENFLTSFKKLQKMLPLEIWNTQIKELKEKQKSIHFIEMIKEFEYGN